MVRHQDGVLCFSIGLPKSFPMKKVVHFCDLGAACALVLDRKASLFPLATHIGRPEETLLQGLSVESSVSRLEACCQDPEWGTFNRDSKSEALSLGTVGNSMATMEKWHGYSPVCLPC